MDNRYSIIYKDMTRCCICGSKDKVAIHEVFFGQSNRKKSIEDGCCVPLCGNHHNLSSNGVHFDHSLDVKLKNKMQIAWMSKYYPDLEKEDQIEKFIDRFGKNYLTDDNILDNDSLVRFT